MGSNYWALKMKIFSFLRVRIIFGSFLEVLDLGVKSTLHWRPRSRTSAKMDPKGSILAILSFLAKMAKNGYFWHFWPGLALDFVRCLGSWEVLALGGGPGPGQILTSVGGKWGLWLD